VTNKKINGRSATSAVGGAAANGALAGGPTAEDDATIDGAANDGAATTADDGADVSQAGGRAAARCTFPVPALLDRFRRYESESPYIARFLRADWLDAAMADNRVRRVLAGNKAGPKEVTEAYAAADRVSAAVFEFCDRDIKADGGSGVVILDVCSGKGTIAIVLSFMFPQAKIVMIDSNGDMELDHVSARPNIEFVALDIFAPQATAVVNSAAAGAECCVVIGVHVCGALAPRVATVACRAEAVDAFFVCPCCLKGSLCRHVKHEAKRTGEDVYTVLVKTLKGVVDLEIASSGLQASAGSEGRASSVVDASVLSPKNAFVGFIKPRRRALPREA